MKTAVQQWGNSLALRIPKAFAEQTKVRKGTPVSLTIDEGRIVVEPLKRRKYSLKELVSQITLNNRHDETDWGRPHGKEIW
ncbi:MAG: AbrB/MazE/SpoVT family DNA-binding domain-containing protein [Chloroflexi bacterium]|nr:AbrB/MazE/SpoVT family DNA-binding domain-containing protein [Chloroflexota bacterium]